MNTIVTTQRSFTGDLGEATFSFVPLESVREEWEQLVSSNPAARLYHRARWLEVLRRAYGFELYVAILRTGSQAIAGCLFARSHSVFTRRFVALPFSDRCEPLALDESAVVELLDSLATDHALACEIRGIAAPDPWCAVNCFRNWELDTSGSAARLYSNLAVNFRRNIVKARRGGLKIECGHDLSHIARFRALHDESRRRQGVPSQPAKFFHNLWELYRGGEDIEIWLASHLGKDLASVLVLRDGDIVYYKWSARTGDDTMGAGHLLAWSIIEATAGKARLLDLGRTDERNEGLNRFKSGLGANSTPLAYSFLPRAPREISPEILSGYRLLTARVWRRLPASICRVIGGRLYHYLS